MGCICIVFIFVVPLDSDLSPGGRFIMAAAAAAFEIKVEKISRMGRVVVSWESTEMVAGRRSSSLTGECCSTCETVCTVLI